MKLKGIIFLFLCLILIVPAFAFDTVYTAPQGKALSIVNIVSDAGTTGTIELYQQNGDTTTGSWTYGEWEPFALPPSSSASVTVGSETASTRYVVPFMLWTSFRIFRPFDLNTSTPTVIRGYIGQTEAIANEHADKVVKPYPIVGFRITADKEVVVHTQWVPLQIASLDANAQDINADWIKAIMDLAYLVFWNAIPFMTSLGYWIRYFFITNLKMIVALFLAVPMAFAAKNSKGNPEKFFKQYFATLKGFVLFIILLWHTLLDSIGIVRGWFRL
jgi:hypothetical protein